MSAEDSETKHLHIEADSFPVTHKIPLWRDHFSPLWGHVSVAPLGDHLFDAWVTSDQLGPLRFNTIYHAGQKMVRKQGWSEVMNGSYYVLNISRQGQGFLHNKKQKTEIKPGHIVLSASSQANEFWVPNEYMADQVMISKSLMHHYIPNPQEVYHLAWDKPTTRIEMLLGLINNLRQCEFENTGNAEEREFAVRHIMEFLSFAVENESLKPVSNETSVLLAHRIRINRVIVENAANPDLSPAKLAEICGISESYLHRIISHSGHTVMECVRKSRLEMAKAILSDSRWNHLSVSEVCYQCGFKSPEVFARSFKAMYSMTPKSLRSSVIDIKH